MHLLKKKKNKKKKWERFDVGPFLPSFLGCGADLTNFWGHFDQMGAVLTWGHFDGAVLTVIHGDQWFKKNFQSLLQGLLIF